MRKRERFSKTLKCFTSSQNGSVALIAALMLPVLLGVAALSADYVVIFNKSSKLQQVADSAAIAGALELVVAGNNDQKIEAIVEAFVYSHLKSETALDELKVDASVSDDRRGLTVSVNYYWSPFFAHFFDSNALPINAAASARLAGSASLCSLALDPTQSGSFQLTGESGVLAENCSIQANSLNKAAIDVPKNARIVSGSICSSGGYLGVSSSFVPAVLVDCPQLDDPLSDRNWASAKSNCDYKNIKIAGRKVTLFPGTYCGGIQISKGASVRLASGTYTFVNGDLDVGGGSELSGKGVGLYFYKNARPFIRNASTINLTAPKSGTMTGVLVAGSSVNNPNLLFEIQSRDARQFTGLIYAPANTIKIGDDVDGDGVCDPGNDAPRLVGNGGNEEDEDDEIDEDENDKDFDNRGRRKRPRNQYADDTLGCEANVGQYSDWTAIIARKIMITSGVQLILNSDYEGSSVPVPPNNGSIGAQVRLTK